MENNKNNSKKRGVGYFMAIPAVLCGIAGLFLYREFGVNAFNISLDQTLIILIGVAALIGICGFFIDVKAIRYVSYLLFLYDFIIYIGTQSKYITNVIVGIDGNTFTVGFIATFVCLLLAFVLMLVAALTSNTGKKLKNKEVQSDEK